MMGLTKKHFSEIAKIIKNMDWDTDADKDDIAHNLADYFEVENHLFDREKFLRACIREQESQDAEELNKNSGVVE